MRAGEYEVGSRRMTDDLPPQSPRKRPKLPMNGAYKHVFVCVSKNQIDLISFPIRSVTINPKEHHNICNGQNLNMYCVDLLV